MSLWRIIFFILLLLLLPSSSSLNYDGTLLISLKSSILKDPFSILANWNSFDATPCSWKGVSCTQLETNGSPESFRVTGVSLAGGKILGSIPAEIGKLQHLRNLDLSNNFFNGSLPISIFNSSELQILSLPNNVISGELPKSFPKTLQILNLSDNAFAGNLPENLTSLQNLTVISLKSNYFSGEIPASFSFVQVLDLSSNLFNGSLPKNFTGNNLRYLNFSYNKISNSIPLEFALRIPTNASIDLSFNNLTGAIPQSVSLLNQKMESFAGNENLCGKPLKNLCLIPSSLTTPPNVSSTPAIAAIPKTIGSNPATPSNEKTESSQNQNAMKPITIAAIAIGDFVGITVLGLVILYGYHCRRRKDADSENPGIKEKNPPENNHQTTKKPSSMLFCLTNKGEETSEATSSDSEEHENNSKKLADNENKESKKNGVLITVDNETDLELESLLMASAYILGASNGTIVYRAVLENGAVFAVRRIGESGVKRLKDFENQVRAMAKIRHQNLVRIRGFYWGSDEKLIIYDYVSNGCLAGSLHRKPSSSSSSQSHLSFELRLKIARGIARGLAFLHEKKHVHGNIKPTNILLASDMEPLISDFGLEKLTTLSTPAPGSTRNFGSHRSTPNRELQDGGVCSSPGNSATSSASAYQAPESLKNLKPNPKWDVYSFGIVLLELMSGRVLSERELSQWNAVEDEGRVKKMTDVAIRADVEGKEEVMMTCFRLGFSCSCFVPQKRPSMKEALQVLEKIVSSIC